MEKKYRILQVVLAVIIVVYGVSPVDLVADIVPIIGLIDDIVVAVTGIGAILGIGISRRQPVVIREVENKRYDYK